MSPQYHWILGLPRSGKTTFLAALWHVIDAGEVATKLVLDKLVGDHVYLNDRSRWRRCEEVPRTSMAAETKVAIMSTRQSAGRRLYWASPIYGSRPKCSSRPGPARLTTLRASKALAVFSVRKCQPP